MVKFEDGTGKGFLASVNSLNRVDVSARAANREFYNSRDFGQLYSLISEDAATASAEETLYLQNTSTTRTMYIDKIIISTDAAYAVHVKFVTGTAAGGSVLTPVNLSRLSSNAAEVNARGDGSITGTTDDGIIVHVRAAAGTIVEVPLPQGIILGQNDAIAIESLAVADVAISVIFFYDDV